MGSKLRTRHVCVIVSVTATGKLTDHTLLFLYPDPLEGAQAGPCACEKHFSTSRECSELRLQGAQEGRQVCFSLWSFEDKTGGRSSRLPSPPLPLPLGGPALREGVGVTVGLASGPARLAFPLGTAGTLGNCSLPPSNSPFYYKV